MGSPPKQEESSVIETRPGHHLAAILVTLCGFALAYMIVEFDSFQGFFAGSTSTSTSGIRVKNSRNGNCDAICSARRENRLEQFEGRDLLNRHDVKLQLETAKERLIKKLKIDYGEEYFDQLFVNPKDGSFIPIVPYGGESLQILKRKLMIKVLKAQKNLKTMETNVNGCDCSASATARRRLQSDGVYATHSDASLIEDSFEKFVWTTGGHSAAAAHGNLYNESYTAYMEQDLKGVFGSIGIDFEGRNYAMGGTSSAAEVSMCWKEIYGDDTNFFVWDFGMMDTGDTWRMFHFLTRGISAKNTPPFLVLWAKSLGRYQDMIDKLTTLGFSGFHIEGDLDKAQHENIPDSMGLGSKEIDAMPTMLKYFKCNGALEKNDCDEGHKYSEQCPKRYGKAGWHPGFKWHAMWGHSIALFMVQSLMSAVDDLLSFESENLESLLERLEREEKEHNEQSFKDLDAYIKSDELREKAMGPDMDYRGMNQLPPVDFDLVHTILRGDSICHTSRLPSQIRYRGYLTDSDKVGGPAVFGKETFDTGIELEVARRTSEASLEGVPIVWDSKVGERQSDCEFVIAPDPKDYFYVQHGYGWQQLTVPNESTSKAYSYDESKIKGVVTLILQTCDWGNCPEGFLTPEFFGQPEGWELKVNGKAATNLTAIGNNAIMVHNGDSIIFPPGSNGEYKLEFHVTKPEHYMRLTSAIIF